MNDPLGGLGAPEERPPAVRSMRVDLPPRPAPTSTVLLLALLAVPFLAELWLDWSGKGTDSMMLLRLGALFGPAVADGDWWRLGSYAFLHIGPIHFAMNAWALWVLMREIEWTYGALTAIGIFAASALAGGALSAAARIHNGDYSLVAGASGGIFGLMGASGALLFRLRDLVPPDARRMLWRSFFFNLLINAGIALYAQVDSYAHAGGFLCGGLLGLIAPLPISGKRPWHLPIQLALLSAALLLAAAEGAAVARAVNPRTRLLEGKGVEARVPWMLAPVHEGVARTPNGLGLGAGIFAELEPPQTSAARKVQIGERSWLLRQAHSEEKGCGEETSLVTDDDEGLGVQMCCLARWCEGPGGERIAEQIASTLHLTR